jgi:predicted dehydrogenase
VSIRRNRPLRGAIIGFGNVAVAGHLPTWNADRHFAIQAVCDADPARLAHAEQVLPDARRYAVLDELLAQERLDFVDVATPPATHPAIVLAALARKVHVLCEKPLALASADCAQMHAAAADADTVVYTVHNWKYAPIFRTAKRVLRRGDLGRISHLRLETLRTAPPGGAADRDWRLDPAVAGGGVLVDHGWHAFYLMQYLLDAAPSAVTARLAQRKFTATSAEDTADCTVELPGTVAEIHLTWAAAARENRARIVGDHGTLEIADRTLTVNVDGRTPETTAFAQPLSAGSYHPDWFTPMADDFREELLDRTLRGTNLREAMTTCLLIELAYRSHAESGRRIAVTAEPAPGA